MRTKFSIQIASSEIKKSFFSDWLRRARIHPDWKYRIESDRFSINLRLAQYVLDYRVMQPFQNLHQKCFVFDKSV